MAQWFRSHPSTAGVTGSLVGKRRSHMLHCAAPKTSKLYLGTSPAVQWLRVCASNARDTGSIPGLGTRLRSHNAVQRGQKK